MIENTINNEALGPPTAPETKGVSQARIFGRTLRRSIIELRSQNSKKGKSGTAFFLETNQIYEKKHLFCGIATIIDYSSEILSLVEYEACGLKDERFDQCLQMLRSLERLLAPKKDMGVVDYLDYTGNEERTRVIKGVKDHEWGFFVNKNPSVRRCSDNREVALSSKRNIPLISTFYLKSHDSKTELPRYLNLQVQPEDYTFYRQGIREVDLKTIQGGRVSDIRKALSEKGTLVADINKLLGGAECKGAFIEFQACFLGKSKNNRIEIHLKAEAIEEGKKIKLTWTIPGQLEKVANEIKDEEVFLRNKSGIIEIGKEFEWPGGPEEYYRFLEAMEKSLVRVVTNREKKK